MADDADLAQDNNDLILNATIRAFRSATLSREIRSISECHWCSEPFGTKDQRLFCDINCEQDYRRHKKRNVMEE